MKLTELQMDFFKENFNIGVGRGARVLNTMLSSHIKLSVPEISVVDNISTEFLMDYDASIAAVDLQFNGPLNGTCKLLFPSESAMKLVRNVSDQPDLSSDNDFDAMSEGVLKEIGNIVLNSVVGVLGNTLKVQLHYSVPAFKEYQLEELLNTSFMTGENVGLLARIHFSIENMDVRGEILTIFKMTSFTQLLGLVDQLLK